MHSTFERCPKNGPAVPGTLIIVRKDKDQAIDTCDMKPGDRRIGTLFSLPNERSKSWLFAACSATVWR